MTPRRGLPSAAAKFLAAVIALACTAAPRGAGGPAQPRSVSLLARAYDTVLDARFDAVEGELQQACGPAPPEACDLVRAAALWWRIQLDPLDRSRDGRFRASIDSVIEATSRWTAREPRRAEAWFYLGAAYGVRVQYRVLRLERLAAARDGKRIKEALETALSLDASLQDAHFGIGLYHYYADIGPSVLKLLRWLLLLPGGDRAGGLREMRQGRDHGELLRGEADYQLHLIALWYENDVPGAMKLLEGLRARYPHNPHFLQSIAETQTVYQHDHAASLDSWRALLDLARQGLVALPGMSETRARIGIAEALDALYETDAAVEQARIVAEAKPTAPYGVAARAALRLGAFHDRLGQRADAVAAYRRALALAPPDDPEGVRAAASQGLRRIPDPRTAEAYRLSIEGWRLLQRRDLEKAGNALSRALSIAPRDPVTHYRHARWLLERGDAAAALAEFELVAAQRPVPPPTTLAGSCLEAARLHERAGNLARAVDLYHRATRVRGSDADTRHAAQQSLARLHAR